jgi:hypothetical protein
MDGFLPGAATVFFVESAPAVAEGAELEGPNFPVFKNASIFKCN